MAEGDWDNVLTFGYTEEYDTFIRRFESQIDIDKIKSNEQLERELGKWLGKNQPRQRQMDLFTQYYNLPFYEVPEDRQYSLFEFKSGAMYNKESNAVLRKDKKGSWEVKRNVEIVTYNFKYGKRHVLRDSVNKRIYGHYKDVDSGYFIAKGKLRKQDFKEEDRKTKKDYKKY